MRNNDITVIITVWKRRYLSRQLESIINQVVPPKQIWILQNEEHVEIGKIIGKFQITFPNILVVNSQLNLKYFGRYALAYNVKTEYLMIIDDDVIPGMNWLRTCIEKCEQYQAIIACSGRIIRPNNFQPERVFPSEHEVLRNYFIGDCYNQKSYNFAPKDTQVDYGCNSYFLKADWLQYFWRIWPCTFDSGEDIHLSASLLLGKGVKTIVPEQTVIQNTGNLEKAYGSDIHASWLKSDFIDIRQKVFEYFIREKRWTPILWK